jgi:hypothetical protein
LLLLYAKRGAELLLLRALQVPASSIRVAPDTLMTSLKWRASLNGVTINVEAIILKIAGIKAVVWRLKATLAATHTRQGAFGIVRKSVL